jgi:lipopolysaccharide/colanic/teichoic acid biosynthesis glycosyltransferase
VARPCPALPNQYFTRMATASTKVRADHSLQYEAPAAFPQFAAWPRLGKRLCDMALAGPALVLLSPLFALLMLWIKRDSPGPAFFRQTRMGRHGQPFRIFKFRTMVVAAEQLGAQLTVGQDKRITRSGQFLRRYRLDELPQLINVLKGEMSLVGPRPEVPRYVACYGEHERAILALTPGITSQASLNFLAEGELLARQADPEQFYLAEVMPAKIRTDLAYAQHATVLSDLSVILQTLRRLLA